MNADMQEILQLHRDGTFSRRELYSQMFDLVDAHGVEAILAAAPADVRDGFLRWVRANYDNNIPAREFVVLWAADLPDENLRAIEALRAWLARQEPSLPRPLATTADALEPVGFFREHNDVPDYLSLDDVRGARRPPNKAEVLAYLRAGKILAVSPGRAEDHFARGARASAGTMSVLTDGVYKWPAYLAYYVDKYDVALPMGFERHMEHAGWRIPAVIGVETF
jgi:hypothetical protein